MVSIVSIEYFEGQRMNAGMKWLRWLLVVSCAALPCGAAELSLMPWPSQVTRQDGAYALDRLPKFQVEGCDERVRGAETRFVHHLAAKTGVRFDGPANVTPEGLPFTIHCAGRGLAVQALEEDESYHLTVTAAAIELTAATPLGAMHGLETVLQLAEAGPQGWDVPAVKIDDTPRFAWRGLMIDVSRHFMPLEQVERNVDGMAAVKLNILHMHLSDDEGFRVESKKAPKLTEKASDGLFYTQEQVKQLIAYARERGVRVVPEFDVPGHAVAWLTAYPELASGAAPAGLVRNETDTVRPPLDPTNEETYKLLDKVFGEMEGLFPDRYFHIGGDEVDGKYWDSSERIQAWKKAHNIKDDPALQAYFTKRVQAIVKKHGKAMEGWDEIMADDLPKDALIQSWRGPKSLSEAATRGFKTVLSAGYYLDLQYPASNHYAVDPMTGESAGLTAEQKALILGGEAAQWTEYVTPEILDNRLWPRLAAVAERLWSPQSVTDVDSMYRRLAIVSRDLDWLGLQHNTGSERMLARIAGSDCPLELLKTLADTVEPVKEYDRGNTQKVGLLMPLNHLVDAVPPESDVAREVNALAVRAVKDPAARAELRIWFVWWRDNDARLAPYLPASELRAQLAPLSHDLATLGTMGLAALDRLEAGRALSAEEQKAEVAKIDALAAHHAEMYLVVTPAVKVLVDGR
jgi:hexosaminidase